MPQTTSSVGITVQQTSREPVFIVIHFQARLHMVQKQISRNRSLCTVLSRLSESESFKM